MPYDRAPRIAWSLLAGLCALQACDRAEPPSPVAESSPPPSDEAVDDVRSSWPSTARAETHRELRRARTLQHAAGDGGGSARLVDGPPVPAGSLGTWTLEYTAGPEGVDVGGAVVFQVSPFWGWSPPQADREDVPGYTEASCDQDDVQLALERGPQLLAFRIEGAPLRPHSTVTWTYGAGVGAVADRYAESLEWFYVWVDADGDGTRKLLDEDVAVSILPRPAARLVVTIPTTRRPGESVSIRLASVDRLGNRAPDFRGTVQLTSGAGLTIPDEVTFDDDNAGVRVVDATVAEPGVHVVRATLGEVTWESNPMVVAEGLPRVYWADLHGHSTWSDGTGSPDDYFAYGRDVAGLDVCVLTEHDHYGMRKLDADPELWSALTAAAHRAHDPGRFVTLVGYEWTSWLYGHRHVLYFDEGGPVYSALDDSTDDPSELWNALRSHDARTLAHHSASGAVVATDWSFAPPSDLEPVVEIVSVHGNSEGRGAPRTVRGAVDGSFVRDALARGYRLGFVGSGDSHDGHPGLAHLASPAGGGLAAFRAETLTRASLREALDKRWTYATDGARLFVGFRLANTPMGGVHPTAGLGTPEGRTFHAFVVGTDDLRHVDLIKNGEPFLRLEVPEGRVATFDHEDAALSQGDWVYLRATQADGHLAWSSPIWIE